MADAAAGRRILGEVEETSLDEILRALRTRLNSTSTSADTAIESKNIVSYDGRLKHYPIPMLDDLVSRHYRATQSAPLSVSGRNLPLVYLLIATLIAAPRSKAVLVIDVDGRFDVTSVMQCSPFQESLAGDSHSETPEADITTTSAGEDGSASGTEQRLHVTPQDLQHIHVYRPARGSRQHMKDVVSLAEQYMVYGKHGSTSREWWGTVVIGGGHLAGLEAADVTTGWRGWLRVDREEVRGFGIGMSVEEALTERERRHTAVAQAGWKAECVWGGFRFGEQSEET